MNQYGIKSEALDADSLHIEELLRLGFTVISGVLSESELIECRSRLDKVYELQVSEFRDDNLAAIQESNLARLPLSYDHWFCRLVDRREILQIVHSLMGDYVTLHLQNGILNTPDETHHQSSWHRDLPYQEWVSSVPLALSALFCIDPFNAETGATFVLPGSHRDSKFPSKTYVAKHETQIEAAAGSVLLFDSMLFHRAGTNFSTGIRRGVNHVYTTPIIRQQIEIPAALKHTFEGDSELRRLLGFDSPRAESVLDWRQRRSLRK